MGAWDIDCFKGCEKTWTGNILDLIKNHLDENGWILCGHCGNKGYIKKEFQLQEEGEFWKPCLTGVIRLGSKDKDDKDDVYQPFVFLVSYKSEGSDKPEETPCDVWFCYYKDTRKYENNRKIGGNLKMGYGPGGPPVLKANQVEGLVKTMRDLGVSFE